MICNENPLDGATQLSMLPFFKLLWDHMLKFLEVYTFVGVEATIIQKLCPIYFTTGV
jgi:hypothetical protein